MKLGFNKESRVVTALSLVLAAPAVDAATISIHNSNFSSTSTVTGYSPNSAKAEISAPEITIPGVTVFVNNSNTSINSVISSAYASASSHSESHGHGDYCPPPAETPLPPAAGLFAAGAAALLLARRKKEEPAPSLDI